MIPITGKGLWKEWIDTHHGGRLWCEYVPDDHGNEMFEIYTDEKGGPSIQRIPSSVFRQRFELVNDDSNVLLQSTRKRR